DFLAGGDQAALHAEAFLEQRRRAAEELLVLRLVLGEAQQRPQPRLVAVDVSLGSFESLRNDVFLDVREDVAVRVAHDLVQLELLVVVQAADVVRSSEPIGKKPPGVVEIPPLENLALRPGDLERVLKDVGVRVIVGKHVNSPFASTIAPADSPNNGNSVPNRPD